MRAKAVVPAADSAVFGRLAVPAICRDLTTARLLTTADLVAISLVGVASAGASLTSRRLRVTLGELEAA